MAFPAFLLNFQSMPEMKTISKRDVLIIGSYLQLKLSYNCFDMRDVNTVSSPHM